MNFRNKTQRPKYSDVTLQKLYHKPESYWITRGHKATLLLFQQMATRVPAYKDFLRQHRIDYKKVKNIADLAVVPSVDKDNYLRQYPLSDLCWDGQLKQEQWVFSTTSGSTGEPFYFPRTSDQDLQYALTAEAYLQNNFDIQSKSTLYINGFAMGAWIGGLFTYQALKHVAERGDYKLSIISPGIFKKEIIKAVRRLGPQFDQIIIGGYPPMIKDMIDESLLEGINWKEYNVGFVFSAEGFSEEFRDYIADRTGIQNPYLGTLNHYGTVDLGTMAHETPEAILIRRLANHEPKLKSALFPEPHRLPTFAQYLPELFYFEEINHTLYASAHSGIPLVRYNLKDYGGVISHQEIDSMLQNYQGEITKVEREYNLQRKKWNLPFVYVYERQDFVVKLYGANIYPESIRKVLQKSSFQQHVTGKCTLLGKYDADNNQYLEVNIELKSGSKSSRQLKEDLSTAIIKQLLKENSEYTILHKEIPGRLVPAISLWSYEHPEHFSPNGKQKWVKS